MEVHKTVYDIDMNGKPYSYEITETCYFDEWTDFDN